MNKLLQFVFVVFAVAFLVGCSAQAPMQDDADETMPDETMPESDVSEPEDTQPEPVQEPDRVIQMTGENYAFFVNGEENPELRVQEGDLVRIEFESTQGFHDVVIDAFGASEQVRADDGATVLEFVADQTGEFEYYCSVGSHRQQGMFGTLIVE